MANTSNLYVTLKPDELDKLADVCNKLNMNKTQVIRTGISILHNFANLFADNKTLIKMMVEVVRDVTEENE